VASKYVGGISLLQLLAQSAITFGTRRRDLYSVRVTCCIGSERHDGSGWPRPQEFAFDTAVRRKPLAGAADAGRDGNSIGSVRTVVWQVVSRRRASVMLYERWRWALRSHPV